MAMSGYTKLFSSIVTSTVWREPDHVRIVWVTMLALSDRWGVVEASVPGLADMARVSISQCQKALRVLSSPDKHSRTQENDGRRIREIDGGWELLNHGKYRDKMSVDERRAYNAMKQRESRAKRAVSLTVNDKSATSAHTEAEADPDTEKIKPSRASRSTEVPDGFEDFWERYPRKTSKTVAIRAWSKLQPDAELREKMFTALEVHKKSRQWSKDGGEYIPYPASWINQKRWTDQVITAGRPKGAGPDYGKSWYRECEQLHHSECAGEKSHAAKVAAESKPR